MTRKSNAYRYIPVPKEFVDTADMMKVLRKKKNRIELLKDLAVELDPLTKRKKNLRQEDDDYKLFFP